MSRVRSARGAGFVALMLALPVLAGCDQQPQAQIAPPAAPAVTVAKPSKRVIADQDDYDTDLAERLSQRYGLRHAVVVRALDVSAGGLTDALGRAAAALLEETLVDGQTLAVAWGRTLAACAGALTRLPLIDVVQAIGSLAGAEYAQSSVDLVHRLAALSRGAAYPLYLPMWLEDQDLVERLRSEPAIIQATARFAHIDVLVSGIGTWDPPIPPCSAPCPWRGRSKRGPQAPAPISALC